MKCIQRVLTGEITRVTDEEAAKLTAFSAKGPLYRYVPKWQWKSLRDAEKAE